MTSSTGRSSTSWRLSRSSRRRRHLELHSRPRGALSGSGWRACCYPVASSYAGPAEGRAPAITMVGRMPPPFMLAMGLSASRSSSGASGVLFPAMSAPATVGCRVLPPVASSCRRALVSRSDFRESVGRAIGRIAVTRYDLSSIMRLSAKAAAARHATQRATWTRVDGERAADERATRGATQRYRTAHAVRSPGTEGRQRTSCARSAVLAPRISCLTGLHLGTRRSAMKRILRTACSGTLVGLHLAGIASVQLSARRPEAYLLLVIGAVTGTGTARIDRGGWSDGLRSH